MLGAHHDPRVRPHVRAAASAASVEVEAVSSMWPCQSAGRPSSCATQRTATYSSSVPAGEARRGSRTAFRRRDQLGQDGRLRRARREVGEEARVVPVRDGRQDHLVEVAQDVRELLGLVRRRRRQRARQLARPTCAITGSWSMRSR